MNQPFVPNGAKVRSISELTREVKGLIEEGFPSVWVAGEVSNLARPSSGHMYLTLKDPEAQLRTVIYRGVSLRLRFDLRDGMDVIARGRLGVYMPRGEYQLLVEELHPKGIGALELAFQQLKEKLSRLGYFEPARKRPLPRYPRRVVLVTSPSGAAIRDMLEVLGRRWPALEVCVCPVRVQGDGAAREIADAVRFVNEIHRAGHLEVDVLIVGRGGGSLEDLWAFNEECVAHAIFRSQIPVVSGVGHETDLTICDLVADLRALTPTHAAAHVVPDREEVLRRLADCECRLRERVLRRLDRAKQCLDDLVGRVPFRLPLERVHREEQQLDDWQARLDRAARQRMAMAGERLESYAARLESLSPLNVLGRGYSLTRTEVGRVLVRSPEQVRTGDRLVTVVAHGQIISRVEESGPAAS
jgi:exodeoxyribonuclease VII large subunit